MTEKIASFTQMAMKNAGRITTKLLLLYVLLAVVMSVSLSAVLYLIASKNMEESIGATSSFLIAGVINDLSHSFSEVRNASDMMMSDHEIYDFFDNLTEETDYDIHRNNLKIQLMLNDYFARFETIKSVHLVTDRFVYGSSTAMVLPSGRFIPSEVYRDAKEANGRVYWQTTYRYSEMYSLPIIEETNVDYKYVFGMNRLMRFVKKYETAGYRTTTQVIPPEKSPLLVVHFTESQLERFADRCLVYPGSYYYFTDRDGQIISHSDKAQIGKPSQDFVPDPAKYLHVFKQSPITDWTLHIAIPRPSIFKNKAEYVLTIVGVNIFVMLLFTMLYIYMSKTITSRLKLLLQAMNSSGRGVFSKLKTNDRDEIDAIFVKFNEMNTDIQKLIEQVVEISRLHREAEINALQFQMNPHFLYNTLNVINWMAYANQQHEISRMLVKLSKMLSYTVDNRSMAVPFNQDLEWLENYIHIMQVRFKDRYEVLMDIEPRLKNCVVPKLFIQPFVENAYIHGLDEKLTGGTLRISAVLDEEDQAEFVIEDNGKGIPPEMLEHLRRNLSDSIGMGNVVKRIHHMYGEGGHVDIESENGIYTRIIIRLPVRYEEK